MVTVLIAGAVCGMVVLVGLWLTTRRNPSVPSMPPSATIDSAVLTSILDANTKMMMDVMERSLEMTAKTLEKAAFGTGSGEDGPTPLPSDATIPVPPDPDAPPWALWGEPDEITEASDRDVPEWQPMMGPRAVSVRQLPDFTGETME